MNDSGRSRTPLYLTIKQYLLDQVASGALKAEDRLPGEQELMEQFSVSKITINKALTSLAQDGRIQRIPGRGSFVLPPAAGPAEALPQADGREGRKPGGAERSLGFIIQSINDAFSISLLNGMLSAARAQGYALLVRCSLDQEGERAAIRQLSALGVEGLVIFPVDQETYSDEILRLKLSGFPLVLVDRVLPGIETHQVLSDNRLGAELAVDHLYGLGHRSIAIYSSAHMPTSSTDDRILGYVGALEQRGELVDPHLIIPQLDLHAGQAETHQRLRAVLESGRATACIATESNLAVRIYCLCCELGIRVPEDFSILSFDDPMPSFGVQALFTHISQSERRMGQQAAQLLMTVIEDRRHGRLRPFEKILLRPELVVRRSTGPLPQGRRRPAQGE